MIDTAKGVERPNPITFTSYDAVRAFPVEGIHYSSFQRYADAKDAELAALQVKLGEAEYERDLGNDALSEAREAAGPHDRPFLDDAVAGLRHRAERSDALVGKLKEELERQTAAINWACGCGEDGFSSYQATVERRTQPRYWWRAELARRAGLVYDGSKYQSAALKACEGGQ